MEKINNVLNFLLMISLFVPGIRAMEQSGKHSSYRIQVGNDIIQAKSSTLHSIRAFKNLFEDLTTTEEDFIDLSTSLKSAEQQESFKKMIAVIEEEYKNQDFSDYSIDQIMSILNCANDHDAPVAKKILLQECLNRFRNADNSIKKQIISALEGSSEKDGLNYDDRQQLYADLKLREALSALTLRKVENSEEDPQNIVSYKTDYSRSADGTRSAKIRFEKKDHTTVADVYNTNKEKVAILYNQFGNTGSTMGPQKGTSPVFSIAFNREGTLLALGGANGNVSLFEVEELEKDNKEQPKPKMVIPYNHAVTGLSFHPTNPELLYVAINNGSVYKWDINDNSLKGAKSFFREGCITQLFIHKEKLYVANDVGLNVLNLDLEDIITLPVGKTEEVGISQDGNFIIARYHDKETLWRLNLNLKKEFTKDEILFLIALSQARQANKKLILCEHYNQDLGVIYKNNPDLLQISPRFIQDSCSMRCSLTKTLKSYWNKEKK